MDALRPVGTRVQTARPRPQGHPGLLLEAHPLVVGAAGERDVGRVDVGPAVDPGRPVRAAPVVADGVLLEEQHGVPPTGQLTGSRGAGEPGTHDCDVVVVRPHRVPPEGLRSVTRSRSSSLLSSVSATSPEPSTDSARLRLRSSSWPIRCSMVPSVTRRCTWTARVWPIRWARSVAWSSTAGFHQRSKWMTWSAPGEVEAGAAGLEREQEHRRGAVLEVAHHLLAGPDRGAAVQEQGRDRGGGEVAFEQARHRDVLGEDEHRAVLGQDRAEQLVAQVELLRAPVEPAAGLPQVVRGVVADLLQARSAVQAPARGGWPRRTARSSPSTRARAPRRAPPALGSARRRGRSRSSPAARGRCPDRTCGDAAGTARRAGRTGVPPRGRHRSRSARPRPCGRRCASRAARGWPSRGSPRAR